jgi:YVTN family beta-propeller protein
MRQVGAVLPTGRGPTGLSLDSIRGRVYAALQRDDELEFIDTTSRDVVARVRLRPGDAPRDLAVVRGGALLVVNEGSGSVSMVDVEAAAEVTRIPVGEQPSSIIADRSGARAYVLSTRTNSITAVDAATQAAVGRATTDPEPIQAAIDASGSRLYVVHRRSLYVSIHTLPNLAFERQVFVGAPAASVKVDPRTDLVYVALADEPRVEVIDPLSFVPLGAIEVASPVTYMAIDDVENTMFMVMPRLRAVSVLDLTSRREVAVLDVGAEPHEVALAGERR